MHPMLNIAVRSARAAGNVIVRAFEQDDKIEVELKGTNDFVTNIDVIAEQTIVDSIKKSYPDHSIIGEECGLIEGKDNDYQWIIDPLDGTTNFVKGIPHFAVSIALKVKGKLDQEEAKAANMERTGKKVPDNILKVIDQRKQKIIEIESDIEARQNEIPVLKLVFDKIIKRLELLTNKKAANYPLEPDTPENEDAIISDS